MNKQIERILVEGNLKFQSKLIQGIENININGKIPKYPVLILTCMDPRIDVHRIFQLNPGDVFILRNAGNLYSKDVFRSILLTIYEYNIKDIIVLGHLDCGMTKIRLKELRNKINKEAFNNPNGLVKLRKLFKPFVDEIKNIHDQLKILRSFKDFPSDIMFSGMLYDVDTGIIFEENIIKDFNFIENFKKNYQNLLNKKSDQLRDYIKFNSGIIYDNIIEFDGKKNTIENKKDIIIENNNVNFYKANFKQIRQNKLDIPINEMHKIAIDIPKINIPKIYLPKVKANIPNIYRKQRRET